MRVTTNALVTIGLGGLLSFASVASAQPGRPAQLPQPAQPRAVPAQPDQDGSRGQPNQVLQGPEQRGQAVQVTAAVNPFANPRPEPNVVLEEIVARVAEASGRDFLIHASVPARIYVGGTLPETPSYPQLVSILASNNLAVFESEGIVNVAPDVNARSFPTRLVQVDDESIPGDEIVTRVLTLPAGSVPAPQLVPILRPMQPQNAHLSAPSGNDGESDSKLVIVDRYANVKRITEIVRQIVGSVELQ